MIYLLVVLYVLAGITIAILFKEIIEIGKSFKDLLPKESYKVFNDKNYLLFCAFLLWPVILPVKLLIYFKEKKKG